MANWIEKNGALVLPANTVITSIASPVVVGSTSLTEAELGVLDGVTPGAVAASKAIVMDSSNAITNFGSSVSMQNFGNFSTSNGGILAAKFSRITSASVSIAGSFGSALTQTIKRDLTGMTNAAATTVATITIPNQQNTASFEVHVTGYLGAGGAIGAGEAHATNNYLISVTRTAGVDTAVAISSAYGAVASAVAGAATCTAVVTLGAVTGLSSATQTVAIQVTVSRSGGSSANHVAKTIITCTQHQGSSPITCT